MRFAQCVSSIFTRQRAATQRNATHPAPYIGENEHEVEIQDGKGRAGVRSVGHTGSVGSEGRGTRGEGRGRGEWREAREIAMKGVWRVSNGG